MKKNILLLIFILTSFINKTSSAQAWKWAYTVGSTPRSQAVAIKEDFMGDYYFASYTDSVTVRQYAKLEKHDASQQLLWQKQIMGNVTITDVEINSSNHAIVLGYYLGSITIDGITLTSFSPSENSGFIFEADETGFITWVRDLNPVSGDFKTNDLFIAFNGDMYITSEVSGNFGFCAFHQLDMWGFITKNEFNNNFENRTFSHIIADNNGNVYLSGTCGNGATFDTINSNSSFAYQNFLIKYDNNFNAQWFISKEYATFDDNNGLSTDGQNLYWAFDEFSSNADTVRIIKTDYSGQVLNSLTGPLGMSFFPSIAYTTDFAGNSILVLNTFVRYYIYRYDAAFNLTWQDTLYTSTSGFPLHCGLACYDSSFYLASYYMTDSIEFDNMTIHNPNVGANYRSDLFVAKWSNQVVTSLNNSTIKNNTLMVFPNPADDGFAISGLGNSVGDRIKIFDAVGNVVCSERVTGSTVNFHTINFANGIYFLKVFGDDDHLDGVAKMVVIH